MNETIHTEPAPASTGRLVWGLVLLSVGILAFFDAIDLWDVGELWRWWPVVLIVLGVAHEIDTLRTRRGDGGYILIAIGVWMLAGTHELMGLDYRTGFPLAIAVAGMGIILHALIGVEGKKEKQS